MQPSVPVNDSVTAVITPKLSELGELQVRRALPSRPHRRIGPWLFVDEMGPVDFEPGQGLMVPPHPHINLATVSYLFSGALWHRDSLGSQQLIRPGDINLMIAGRGIVHSERQNQDLTTQPHRLHGLQLWLALPEADEEMAPEFHHYPAATLPSLQIAGVPVRLLIGQAYGACSPVKTLYSSLYFEAQLAAGQLLTLAWAEQRALYLIKGQLKIEQHSYEPQQLLVLSPKTELVVEAIDDCQLVVLGGQAIGPRFMEWNYVSSRKDRIAEAALAWQQGRFAPVIDDDPD